MTPDDPVFDIIRPTAPERPLVFASPHSGAGLPDDFGFRADLWPDALHSGQDLWVDELVGAAPTHGAALIWSLVSRAYVDLNRAEDDRDPWLSGQEVDAVASARARAGYGVVPRLTGDGRMIHDRPLSEAEIERRLERAHRPYHRALGDLVRGVTERHGACVVIDCHSMPDRAAGRPICDVVLGDRHGQSSAGVVVRRLKRLLEGEGLRVRLNQPFAGGWTTQALGRPGLSVHAVQMELRRGLYLDETSRRRTTGFDALCASLDRVIGALCGDPGV